MADGGSPRPQPGEVTRELGPVSIRRAQVADLSAVAAIEAQAFSNPWPPEAFLPLMARGRVLLLVAEDPEDGVVGYAVTWWVLDQAELANLAVRQEHRGRGIGSALLDGILEEIREQGVESVFLEVRVSNERARGLYLSRGFTQIAVRADYYENPREDARILVKALVETFVVNSE